MVRQKCSYKNDIETLKKPKIKKKNTTSICNLTKTNKR